MFYACLELSRRYGTKTIIIRLLLRPNEDEIDSVTKKDATSH